MSLINRKDRIFIAGANGMVGSAISRSLKNSGYHLLLTPSRQELDLLNHQAVELWFKKYKPNIVILAAAKVGGIYANSNYPAEFILQNIKIQTNVIEQSWLSNVRRLLFLGSSCIYPKHSKQPIKEEELLTGKLEETNLSYAIAKISGIKLCDALRKQYGFDAISLMPTNLYGLGDNYNLKESHVLPALIRKFHEAKTSGDNLVTCWGSGNPLREFLNSEDLGSASVFALENWNPFERNAPKDINGNVLTHLNIGTGNDLTIKSLAEKIAEIVGFKGKIKWDMSFPDGTPKKQLDVSRMRLLGWESKISLEEGIKLSYQDFLSSLASKTIRK